MTSTSAAHDLSMIGLFLQADPIVKGVMLLLVAASVACWAIIFDKTLRIGRLKRMARGFERDVRAGQAMTAGSSQPGSGLPARIVAAGRAALADSSADETRAERNQRIREAMRATVSVELRGVEPGIPLLATIGSAAPFIGLFGTVWGIMNSFSAIAKSMDTSLAVVAPGIAEALFATAIGLVAAIPAVMAYNKLSTDLGRIGQSLNAAIARLSDEFARPIAVAAPVAPVAPAAPASIAAPAARKAAE